MEYQKIKDLLDSTPNQPSNFREKSVLKKMMMCVELMTSIVKPN